MFGFLSDAYWLDLGTPQQYLRAHFDILQGKVAFEPDYVAPFVADSAQVDLRAHLGRWVVVGVHVSVGPDAEIEDSVLHAGAVVEAGAKVSGSVVGPRVRIGAAARVSGSALAEGAVVPPGTVLDGAKVSAGQTASPT